MSAGTHQAVTLADVSARRDYIVDVGRRHGVYNIRVFGSVARGESTPTSDLDLLVDLEPGHGYVDMVSFALAVEDSLGVLTQVATVNGLKRRVRDQVLAEAVAV
ncbi:nucleotidyltransferase family protein [Pseudonocardia sp. ICBG1034]|uniref:nucleotidyltransferase family protein n=1 Tax=Pseudonocardia sp. ICBG1034 TaxID=2844381 RepID=UPI001CCDA4FA|nr:nucleotidyltransferase family protein [Pseudonocardia sp. ICBG1034]